MEITIKNAVIITLKKGDTIVIIENAEEVLIPTAFLDTLDEFTVTNDKPDGSQFSQSKTNFDEPKSRKKNVDDHGEFLFIGLPIDITENELREFILKKTKVDIFSINLTPIPATNESIIMASTEAKVIFSNIGDSRIGDILDLDGTKLDGKMIGVERL